MLSEIERKLREMQNELYALMDSNGDLNEEQRQCLDLINYAFGETDTKPEWE